MLNTHLASKPGIYTYRRNNWKKSLVRTKFSNLVVPFHVVLKRILISTWFSEKLELNQCQDNITVVQRISKGYFMVRVKSSIYRASSFTKCKQKRFFFHFFVAGTLKRNGCFFFDHREALRKKKWLFFPPSLGSFTHQRFMRNGKEGIDLKHSKVNWKIYSGRSMNTLIFLYSSSIQVFV